MKRKNETILIGVVFPENRSFLSDYFASIKFQDTSEFDILILNDGLKGNFIFNDNRITIINIQEKTTPAKIRMKGIRYALENGYKNLILSDSDDYFSSNRVSVSINELKNNDFVFNELCVVNSKKKIIQRSLYEKFLKHDLQNLQLDYLKIIDRNIFGLGNSSVRTNVLKEMSIPDDIIAVDWWVFSVILLNQSKGSFVNEAITYYRQHENNIVGARNQLNILQLTNGIIVKKIHYKNLFLYCKNHGFKEAEKIYNNKLEEIVDLERFLQDSDFQNNYIKVINENYNSIYNGWWSEILSLEEWKKYEQ